MKQNRFKIEIKKERDCCNNIIYYVDLGNNVDYIEAGRGRTKLSAIKAAKRRIEKLYKSIKTLHSMEADRENNN